VGSVTEYRFSNRAVSPRTNAYMKITRHFRLCLTIATLGCAAMSPALFGQAAPSPGPAAAVEPQGKTIPMLKIRSGPLNAAVEELSRALEAAHLPGINVIYAPDTPATQVPDLVLRNVRGSDALRLITVSAGWNSEPILGEDGLIIGFRLFPPPQGASGSFGNREPDPPIGINPASSPVEVGKPLNVTTAALAGSPALPPLQVLGIGGMTEPNSNAVRVYSLGGITNTTKFADVEATLRDVLKAAGISADAAKLAFHEGTNVLVVTADSRVHDLVAQYLDALQKNVAVAMAEEKRGGADRRELIEVVSRLKAEQDQRERVTKQLEDTEALFRNAQRELDRIKAGGPKGQ
jgi:hypothetical protein